MNIKNKLSTTILTSLLLFIGGCTDSSGAKKALESAGYSDIRTGGYGFFSCGEGDFYSTKFIAKNPKGKETTGTVCSAMLKGSTIRH